MKKRSYKNNRRSAARRRTSTKRASAFRKARGMVPVPRPVSKTAFPDFTNTTLRYTARRELAPAGTTLQGFSYKVNGLYDPNPLWSSGEGEGNGATATGLLGGHQPRGFDQYMAVYGRYRVKNCRAIYKVVYEGYSGPSMELPNGHMGQNPGVPSGHMPALSAVVVMLEKDTDGFVPRTATEQMERPGCNWKFMTPNDGVQTMTMSANINQLMGPGAVDPDKLTGTSASNPESNAFFHLSVARCSDDYPTSVVRVVVYVKFEFDVTFDRKVDYASS